MDENQIKQLIEKYFEGVASLEEEQMLKAYFLQNDIPEELKTYQPIFRFYLEAQQEVENNDSKEVAVSEIIVEKRIGNRFRAIGWIGLAAAACFTLFIRLNTVLEMRNEFLPVSLAYVDGKKLTNIESIQTEALKSLEDISEENDEVLSSQIEALTICLE